MHPFASGHNSGGDKIYRYTLDNQRCKVDEFLSDGDAFVTWEDGTYGTVKWRNLERVEPLHIDEEMAQENPVTL